MVINGLLLTSTQLASNRRHVLTIVTSSVRNYLSLK
uniref:Uncharacterized protein n=1 Tax=Triticum urartu TaxID=4572 RepID=A0A8R7Q4C5_TRIUA